MSVETNAARDERANRGARLLAAEALRNLWPTPAEVMRADAPALRAMAWTLRNVAGLIERCAGST